MIKVFCTTFLIDAKHGKQLFWSTFNQAEQWLQLFCTVMIEAKHG